MLSSGDFDVNILGLKQHRNRWSCLTLAAAGNV